MPEEVTTFRNEPPAMAAAPIAPTAAPEELVRRASVEVAGNWVIDRDFGVVRRRYWGKVPSEGMEYPEV